MSTKIINLKHLFLSDTIFFGSDQSSVSELSAFSSCSKQDAMTYILKSRIPGIESMVNHIATTFITDFLPSEEDQLALFQASKNIIHNSNARLQMAKLSIAFDYKKQTSFRKFSNTLIHNTAHVEDFDAIGDGTIIYANVTIYKGVKIGKNCIIHSGTVIGSDGFGYEQDKDGGWFKIAHLGSVVIGDNVEIGANTCIDRGTLSDTIIEDGVKIDNLVHIAHNVHVKKKAVIIANAMIAGSVVIGESAWIAPSSSIREGKKIGNNALVGLGSVVVKDVLPNTIVMGVPAKEKNP